MAIDGEFPATLDATKNGYQLVRLGLAETLTRLRCGRMPGSGTALQ